VPHDPDSTNTSLLERLQGNDADAWRRFVHLYGPLVYRWCRRCDLQGSDSADVAQEVFRSVESSIAAFDGKQEGATFRGWLWTITRNKVRDHVRRRRSRPDAIGGSAIQQKLLEQPDVSEVNTFADDGDDDLHALLHRAMDSIKSEFESSSWTAFLRITVEGQSAAEVADDLSLSVAAVRQAKYRILRRLRREISDFS